MRSYLGTVEDFPEYLQKRLDHMEPHAGACLAVFNSESSEQQDCYRASPQQSLDPNEEVARAALKHHLQISR
jgi:hypothetical protein